MAVSGLPDPAIICPNCRELLHWVPAAKGYLHTLSLGCPRNDVAEGNVWPEED